MGFMKQDPVLTPNLDRRATEGIVLTQQYTYVVRRSRDNQEHDILHDNVKDPYQLRNIANDRPELKKRLRVKLEGWLVKINDPWITVDRKTITSP